MNDKSIAFLKFMFNEEDTICVSDSQFAYHSVPLTNILSGRTVLLSPNPTVPIKTIDSSQLIFSALNPIKGYRNDQNCYKFRNFLIEIDVSSKEEQINYIKKLGIPYSAMVWSGSKSTHTLISLSEDLPNESIYRMLYKWMLNIITLADQALGNPSRSIRLAGAIRPETGQKQELLELKEKITLNQLISWLNNYPEAKPKKQEKRPVSSEPDFTKIKLWVSDRLVNGLDPTKGRNRQWFAIAVEFGIAGYSEEDAIAILSKYFTPDKDFKEKEWLTTIESAFKFVYDRNQYE